MEGKQTLKKQRSNKVSKALEIFKNLFMEVPLQCKIINVK
jgi:hypothetical protein